MASVLMANTRAPLPAPVSTARPKGQSFLYSTTLTAGPEEPLVLGLSNLRVEIVHLGRAADSIIIIRNAGVGTTALQSAITIAGSKFPKPGAHIPGRPSQAKQGRQRGVVQFPRGKTPCTLLHRATRAVLGALNCGFLLVIVLLPITNFVPSSSSLSNHKSILGPDVA